MRVGVGGSREGDGAGSGRVIGMPDGRTLAEASARAPVLGHIYRADLTALEVCEVIHLVVAVGTRTSA